MYQLQKEKNINIIFYAATAIGLALSIAHLVQFLFDMIVSVAFYSKVNIPSLAYIVCHFLTVFIPLLMIIPNGKIPKGIIMKWVFYGIALCYLLGCFWVVYFIHDYSFSALFSTSAEQFKTYQRECALSFNYMTWECYTPLNLIFSIIQAFLFLLLGASLDDQRAAFSFLLPLINLLSILVPLIFIFLSENPNDEFANTMSRHLYILGSQVFSSVGLYAISLSSQQWENCLWVYSNQKK